MSRFAIPILLLAALLAVLTWVLWPPPSPVPATSDGSVTAATPVAETTAESLRPASHSTARSAVDAVAPTQARAQLQGWLYVDGAAQRRFWVLVAGRRARTDGKGQYHFDDLPPGTHTIHAEMPVVSASFQPGQISFRYAQQEVTLEAGEFHTLNLNAQTFRLHGTVQNTDGSLPAGSEVVLRGDNIRAPFDALGSPATFYMSRVKRNGQFELRRVPIGIYTVEAFSRRHLTRRHEIHAGPGTTELALILEPLVTIDGEVWSRPDLPRTISFVGPTEYKVRLRGRKFRCKRLIPGHYRAVLHYEDGDVPLEQEFTVGIHGLEGLRL